ncbi:MAG: hypothetical protein ACQGVK_06010 [Myxococcota bacterium]
MSETKTDPRGKERSGAALEEGERRVRARAALGIEQLDADEELIDVETFSELQAALTVRGNADRQGGEPSAPASEPAVDEVLLEEIASELPPDRPLRDGPRSAVAAPSHPGEIARREAQLAAAGDRDQVAEAAIGLALAHTRVCGLLVVSRGMIAGLHAGGEGLGERIEGVALSVDATSLFSRPALTGDPHYGPAPRDGVDARILRALGRSDAAEILILPVAIRGRVVNLLYADNGRDPIPRTSIAALRALTELVAAAYEGLILARKSASA